MVDSASPSARDRGPARRARRRAAQAAPSENRIVTTGEVSPSTAVAARCSAALPPLRGGGGTRLDYRMEAAQAGSGWGSSSVVAAMAPRRPAEPAPPRRHANEDGRRSTHRTRRRGRGAEILTADRSAGNLLPGGALRIEPIVAEAMECAATRARDAGSGRSLRVDHLNLATSAIFVGWRDHQRAPPERYTGRHWPDLNRSSQPAAGLLMAFLARKGSAVRRSLLAAAPAIGAAEIRRAQYQGQSANPAFSWGSSAPSSRCTRRPRFRVGQPVAAAFAASVGGDRAIETDTGGSGSVLAERCASRRAWLERR